MTFLVVYLTCLQVIAQQTDAFGNKVYKANIALIVKEDSFKDGVYQTTNASLDINSAMYTFIRQILLEEGFLVVNRDENMDAIRKLLEEYKAEDYLEGWSVTAKNIGADWLLLVDVTESLDNNKFTYDYSYRLMNVVNNRSFHYQTSSRINFVNESQVRADYQKSLQDNKRFLIGILRQHFPCLFGAQSIRGKEVKLAAYQPVGGLTQDDKLYAFTYFDETRTIQGKTLVFNVLKLLGEATVTGFENGLLLAKMDQKLETTDNLLFSLTHRNPLQQEQFIPVTLGGSSYNLATPDGYLKKQINQAVYCAIGDLPQLSLIESEYKAAIYEEKELQKHEEFLDGYTVQQFKSIGAMYYIHLKNFVFQQPTVKFTIDVIDISQNTLVNSFDVQCHPSNLHSAVSYYLEQVFTWPCIIDEVNSKELSVYSVLPIRLKEGATQILTYIKAIPNPVTGQITYQRIGIAKLKYLEYCGMKHRYEVVEIMDKEEFRKLQGLSANLFLLSDSTKPDLLKDNSSTDDSKPKGTLKEGLKEGFKSLIKNTRVKIE